MSRKLRLLFLMMCTTIMIMAMAVSVYAVENDGGYVVSQSTATGTINVKVVIETKKMEGTGGVASYNVYDVALDSGYTVRDAMFKLSRDLRLFDIYDYDEDFVWESEINQDNIYSLFNEDGFYMPKLFGQRYGYFQDGLKFRVNGKYPLITWNGQSDIGPIGTTMSQTPINDGDVIHFFWDCPRSVSPNDPSSLYSVNFVYPSITSYENGTLDVTIKRAYSYFADSNDCWVVSPFGSCDSPYAGDHAYRILQKGTDTVVASGTINLDNYGSGTITGLSLSSSNTYYIEIDTETFRSPVYADDNTPVVLLQNTKAFGVI